MRWAPRSSCSSTRTTPACALDAAEAEFHRLEALLSRFRDDSELSRLNRDGSIEAGPDLLRVVELALAAREPDRRPLRPDRARRGRRGRLRPLLRGHRARRATAGARSPAVAGGGVSVDGSRIELEPGVRLDLGGIGKGYAAERAAELLALAGPCLVNAGGDVATRGGSWPVGVETADGALTLELAGAALATSGRDRRRWRRGGRELHHLIDPRTGAPAETDLLRVTVVAPDAVEAEVAAKSLFLAGADARAPRPTQPGSPRCSSTETADGARGRAGMTHDPTFWLLARASGLTAYVLLTRLRARRARRQVAAVRPRGEDRVRDRRPPLPRAPRARDARAARRLADARPDRAHAGRGARRSRAVAVPARLGRARRARVRARRADRRLLLRSAAGSAHATGAGSTGRRT